jgi:hypothetical protein
VTSSAGPDGSISPNTARLVNDDTIPQFTVTPHAGYVATVGGAYGGPLAATTYNTNIITANCTVVATISLGPDDTKKRPSRPSVVTIQEL